MVRNSTKRISHEETLRLYRAYVNIYFETQSKQEYIQFNMNMKDKQSVLN